MLLLATLVITPILVLACGDDDEEHVPEDGSSAEALTVDVTATDFAFDPTEISVQPGQAVTIALANSGEADHTFTIDELDFEIEAGGGESVEGTFTAPTDSVRFYCRFHDEMTGTISSTGPVTGGTDGPSPDETGGATPDDTDGATPDDTDDASPSPDDTDDHDEDDEDDNSGSDSDDSGSDSGGGGSGSGGYTY
jgi:plastocyanin